MDQHVHDYNAVKDIEICTTKDLQHVFPLLSVFKRKTHTAVFQRQQTLSFCSCLIFNHHDFSSTLAHLVARKTNMQKYVAIVKVKRTTPVTLSLILF